MISRLRSLLAQPPGPTNRLRLKAESIYRRMRPPAREQPDEEFFAIHSNAPKTGMRLEEEFSHRFFYAHRHRGAYAQCLRTRFPETCNTVLATAAQIMDGTFECFGVRVNCENGIPDWHADFIGHYHWPVFDIRSPIPASPPGSDVKVPWELSRCHWGTALGRAYWLTENQAFAERWYRLVDSWLDCNPVDSGINWCCSMEVAIRAVNLIAGAALFAGAPSVPDMFWRRLVKSCYYHAMHIERFPERIGTGINTNHLVADTVGLLCISTVFPQFDRSSIWRRKAMAALETEIESQTYSDGGNHEGSTAYHRLVLEMFVFAALLERYNSGTVSDQYLDCLRRLCMFSSAVGGDGLAPLIGDNDDGFLLKWSTDHPADHRPLVDLGSAAFGWPVTTALAVSEERLWYLGPAALERRNQVIEKRVHAFPESGYAVVHVGEYRILLAAPRTKPGATGGHRHNDDLSLTIMKAATPLLSDSGTGAYTHDPTVRNRARSVQSHCALIIDDAETVANLGEPFLRIGQYDAQVSVSESVDWVTLHGSHNGYNRKPWLAQHQRTVRVNLRPPLRVVVVDNVLGRGSDERAVAVRWHLPAASSGRPPLHIESFHEGKPLPLRKQPGEWWPRFRQTEPSVVCSCSCRIALPVRVVTLITESALSPQERTTLLGMGLEVQVPARPCAD